MRRLRLASAAVIAATAWSGVAGCNNVFDFHDTGLDAPSQVIAVPGAGFAAVSWSPVERANGYRLYVGTSANWASPGFDEDMLPANPALGVVSASAVLPGLAYGREYFIAVQAVLGSSETSAPSRPVALVPLTIAQAAEVVGAPIWTFTHPTNEQAHLGYSAVVVRNFTGSSSGDLVVGATGIPGVLDGFFRVFRRSPGGGFENTPHWSSIGLVGGGAYTMATPGDLNGDGFEELFIGSPVFGGDEGRVRRFYGSAQAVPDNNPHEFAGVAGAVVNAHFGISLASPRPLDIVIGSPDEFAGGLGSAERVSGDSDTVTEIVSGSANSRCGFSVVALNAEQFAVGYPGAGEVEIYDYANLPTPIGVIGPANGALGTNFGSALASADVDGNGVIDLIALSVPPVTIQGAAYLHVFLNGQTTPSQVVPLLMEPLFDNGDFRYNFSLSAAGDVNGDGFDDVLLGLPGLDGLAVDSGRVSLFLGGAGGLGVLPAWAIEGGPQSQALGISVAPVGDVNDDGFADFLVGSPYFGNARGKVDVFSGGPIRGLTVDAGLPRHTYAGAEVHLHQARVTDPLASTSFSCAVFWGEGGIESVDPLGPCLMDAVGNLLHNHHYANAGTYRVRVHVETADGRVGEGLTTIEVRP